MRNTSIIFAGIVTILLALTFLHPFIITLLVVIRWVLGLETLLDTKLMKKKNHNFFYLVNIY